MRSTFATAALGVALLTGVSQAQAGLLGQTVDINITLDVTDTVGVGSCKAFSASGVTVGGGLEVSAGSFTGRCDGAVDVDITDGEIIFTGVRQLNVGDYYWMVAELTFAPGGISGLAQSAIPTLFRNDGDNPTPTVTVTGGNTVRIVWDSVNSVPFGLFQLEDGGTSIFSVNGGGGQVSEPATLALLGAGLLGLAAVRRRTR
jgi:hypothetical protein